MGYERYPRGTDPQRDYYNRSETQDYGRDYGSGQSGSYSSARQYDAAGEYGRDRDDDRGDDRFGRDDDRYSRYGREQSGSGDYGRREYGNSGYEQRGGFGGQRQSLGRDHYRGSYGSGRGGFGSGNRRDRNDDDRGGFYRSQSSYGQGSYGQGAYGQGSYDSRSGYGRDRQYGQDRGYGRQPHGYDYEERGFFARAGDEVRSWFGDDDAERRREADMRNDDRYYGERAGSDRDRDYGTWRSGQIAALDRDYDEYRNENRSKFESEFSSWRSERQTQRNSLSQVTEHMDVVGSDGSSVGTVDKVRGDRILLTKNDADAGGKHHSIPSRWIQSVDTKVTLSKTADEAKSAWRDEDSKSAMFGYGDNKRDDDERGDGQGRMLNRSFSGTY